MLDCCVFAFMLVCPAENLTHEDLDEMNIEIMRNTLYKAYLDDFAEFCQSLGSTTAEVMGDLLAFEVRAGCMRCTAACASGVHPFMGLWGTWCMLLGVLVMRGDSVPLDVSQAGWWHKLINTVLLDAEHVHTACALLAQTDRRALNITLNSIGTELTRDDRKKLYSNFGLLYPHGHNELSMAEDFDQIRAAMEKVGVSSMCSRRGDVAGLGMPLGESRFLRCWDGWVGDGSAAAAVCSVWFVWSLWFAAACSEGGSRRIGVC